MIKQRTKTVDYECCDWCEMPKDTVGIWSSHDGLTLCPLCRSVNWFKKTSGCECKVPKFEE